MDIREKVLKLEALDLALQDLDRIIKNMKDNNYPHEQINDYVKKRWEVWNEIYKVKSS
jgi:hypothetical protein